MPARTYNLLPGPIKEDPPLPVKERRYLLRQGIYPDSSPATSVLSFSGWDPTSFQHTRRLILKSAHAEPGAFVAGAKEFPTNYDDAVEYFQIAGWSALDAANLAQGMKRN